MISEATGGKASPFVLRGHRLRNRLVATAHASGLIRDGLALPGDAEYWGRIAEGGVGMVVSGATIVSEESTVRAGNLVVAYHDDARPGLARRAEAIRDGGAVPVSQLIHLGRETLGAESWFAPAAPSAVRTPRAPAPPRALREDETERLVTDFVDAALRVCDCGFDGIELHAAHGYLLEQFLARSTNQRTDRYGGGPGGGTALLCDIIDRVRVARHDVIVGIRLSAVDSLLPLDDVLEVMAALESRADVDYLNIAVGDRGRYVKDMHVVEPPLLQHTPALAGATSLPVLVSQAFRTSGQIDAAIEAGAALVGMCRPLIADPSAPAKLLRDDDRNIRPCTGCNEDCRQFDPCLLCSVNPRLAPPGRDHRPANPILLGQLATPAVGPVTVLGAGPAGLEAATALARGGRDVVLHEATDRLGGQLATATRAPHRSGWAKLVDYYRHQLDVLGVDVRFGSAPALADLDGCREVIVAVGAEERLPSALASEGVLTSTQALEVGAEALRGVGDLVLADDGFGWWSLVGVVELAVSAGVSRITVLTPSGTFAAGIPSDGRTQLMPRLAGAHLDVRAFLTPTGWHPGKLRVRHVLSGDETSVAADLVVAVGERVPREVGPAPEGMRVHAIGDCVSARKVAHAVSEGYDAAVRVLG